MADNDPIEWSLYDTDLITKLKIVPYKKGSLYFEFQEVGSGKLEIALDSSVAPLITSGRFLTASYRGALRGGFFVEDFNIIEANESEGEGRILSVTGKGPLSILTDAIVWYDSTQASTRTFLNMSKGKVFYTLITEAQARGGLAPLDIDFDDTTSSELATWSDRGDYSIEVGKSLLDVLRLFAKTGEIEFGVTLQNSATPILLSAYANGIGSDKSASVYFRIGSNCKEVGKEERGDQIKNVLLTKYQRGYVVASDSASIAARRRREDILNVDNAQSSDSALTYAAAQLDAKKDPQISHTLKAFDGVGPRLFVDYSFGDTISADKFGVVETHRVLGIQADFDGDAPSNVIIEVDTIFRDSELETSSKLDDLLTKWNTAKDGNQIEVKQWVSIGEPDGEIYALYNYADLYLVVGGNFTNINGKITTSFIARYYLSTGQWATMGDGSVITDPVLAIAADVNGNLYCATSANKIYLWTGSTWTLKGTASSTIYSLKGIGSELYVTGIFANIDGVSMPSKVAKLNVSTWSPVGVAVEQPCNEIIRYNGDFYGAFSYTLTSTHGLSKLSGGVWVPVFTIFAGGVSTMAIKGDELVFAGSDPTGPYLAFWDGVSTEPTSVIYFDSVAGIFGFVRSLKVYLSDIYVSNVIYITGDDTLYNMIAKYSGGVWSVIDNGMDYTLSSTEIRALEFVDSDLYIGGLFITNDGGINNLAVWVTDFQSLIDHVNNDGNNFDMGAAIHGATAATTLADDDEFGFWQAVAKGLREITVANIKAFFKTYFDTLYLAFTNINLSDGQAINYQFTSSIASNNLTIAIKGLDGNDPSSTNKVIASIGNTLLSLTSALSVTINASYGDVFSWDGGKIQANDAQLFIYLINNNGTPQLGLSPCPTLTTVATNYYDAGGQTGAAGHTNIIMSGTRNATNSCRVLGRVNVNQADNNNWQSPTTAKIVNKPVFETDLLNWTPASVTFGGMTFTITATDIAEYQISNNRCLITGLRVVGTTGGSANVAISLTVPVLANYAGGVSYTIAFSGMVTDTGTPPFVTGNIYIYSGSTSDMYFAKPDFSNYGLGTDRMVICTGGYKVS